MLKLVKYVNERGGQAHITALDEPTKTRFKTCFSRFTRS